MREFHRFNAAMVDEAVRAAQARGRASVPALEMAGTARVEEEPRITAKAECMDVPVSDNHVCLSLPFALGDISLPLPPAIIGLSAVRACLDILVSGGEPVGARLTISSDRRVLMRRTFDSA